MADDTYAKLARTLVSKNANSVDPKLRANILEFYDNPKAKPPVKGTAQEWSDTLSAVAKLRAGTSESRLPAK
jgi:hypothetical protein